MPKRTSCKSATVPKFPPLHKSFYKSAFGRIWRAQEILVSIGEPFVKCEYYEKSIGINPPAFHRNRQSPSPALREAPLPFWQVRTEQRERVNLILSSLKKRGVSKRKAWGILAPLEHRRPSNIGPVLAFIESHRKAIEDHRKRWRGLQNFVHKMLFVPPVPNELKETIQTECEKAHILINRALDRVRHARDLVMPLYMQSRRRPIPGRAPSAGADARRQLMRLLKKGGLNLTEAAKHCHTLLEAWLPELAPSSWKSVLAASSKEKQARHRQRKS